MNSNIGGPTSNPSAPPPTTITPANTPSPVGRNESVGAIPPPGIIPSTSETDARNLGVSSTTDTMSENVVIQGFPATQQWSPKSVYNSPMQSPTLPSPLTDPESQPFEPDWQIATKKLFEKKIREGVVKKNKEGNQELTRSEIEKQVNQILHILLSGGKGKLSKEDEKIAVEATKKTQEAVGLPGTWSINSTQKTDWTPIKTNSPLPPNLEVARKELLCVNCEELLNAIDRVGKRIQEKLPSNSPQKDAVGDLIRIIAQAIRDLKAVMINLQMKDALWAEKTSDAKYSSIDERRLILDETIQKNREAEETRRKQEKLSFIMKIVGPIISAIVVIAGIAALPFTAGASAALIIAGVAISSLMLVYSVLDSTLDVTSKIVAAAGSALEKMFPGEENEWKRKIVKAVFLAVLVTVLVIGIVASGGSAAASASATITKAVVMQAVKIALAQLAIQTSIIAIMSSNILPELFSDLLIKTGAIDPNDTKGKMISQFVITAVSMLIIIVAIARGGSGGTEGIGKSIKTGIEETGKSISNAFKNALDAASKLLKALKEGGQTAIKQIEALIKQLKTMLTQLMTTLKNMDIKELIVGLPGKMKDAFLASYRTTVDAIGRLKDYISSGAFKEAIKAASSGAAAELSRLLTKASDAIGDLLTYLLEISKAGVRAGAERIKQAVQDLKNYITTLPEDLKKGMISFLKESYPRKIQDIFRATNIGLEVGTGIYNGVLGIRLGKLAQEAGELEKAQEISLLLMKLFDELLSSFQEDIKMRSEWLSNLQSALNNVYTAGIQSMQRA